MDDSDAERVVKPPARRKKLTPNQLAVLKEIGTGGCYEHRFMCRRHPHKASGYTLASVRTIDSLRSFITWDRVNNQRYAYGLTDAGRAVLGLPAEAQ
jgi:hypothetical protein